MVGYMIKAFHQHSPEVAGKFLEDMVESYRLRVTIDTKGMIEVGFGDVPDATVTTSWMGPALPQMGGTPRPVPEILGQGWSLRFVHCLVIGFVREIHIKRGQETSDHALAVIVEFVKFTVTQMQCPAVIIVQ